MSRGKPNDYDEYDDGEGDFDGEEDDYDDDGTNSDDLDETGAKRSGVRPVSGLNEDDKKAHHNFLERRRRDHIKGSFQQLSASIPTLQGERVSRAQVLKTASEYIVSVRKRNSQMLSEVEALRRENSSLEKQIAILEKRARVGGANVDPYGSGASSSHQTAQTLSHARSGDTQIKEEPRGGEDYLDDATHAQDLFENE